MDGPDESVTLNSAGKVQGTKVFSDNAEELGEIYDVMLNKRTGKIAYAVLTFGGFLGLGNKYVPLPWELLSYVPDAGGYVISVPKDALEKGPALDEQAAWHADVGQMIETYYEIYAKPR